MLKLTLKILFVLLNLHTLISTSTINHQNDLPRNYSESHLLKSIKNSVLIDNLFPTEYPNYHKFIDTESFNFSRTRYTKGEPKRPELLCEGEFCAENQLKSVVCTNVNYQVKPLPHWSCDLKNLSAALVLDDHFIACEHPDINKFEESYVDETCSLLYTLQYKENTNKEHSFMDDYLTLFIVFALILLVAFLFIYLKRKGFL